MSTNFLSDEFKQVMLSDGIRTVMISINRYGCLNAMVNHSKEAINVFIPKVLPDGTEVAVIGESFCVGDFGTVAISNEITAIQPRAFSRASVKKVIWPKSCPIIPERCFAFSSVENVLNLASVKEIHILAFARTKKLKEIDLSASFLEYTASNAFEGSNSKLKIYPPYYGAMQEA